MTFALIAAQLVRGCIAQRLEDEVDADALLALAEEAHQAAPSTGARHHPFDAHLFRADRALVRRSPQYAKFSQQTHRWVDLTYLLTAAIHYDPWIRNAALGFVGKLEPNALASGASPKNAEARGPAASAVGSI